MKNVYVGRLTGYVVKCDDLKLEIRIAEGVRGFNVPVLVTTEDGVVTAVHTNDNQQEFTVVGTVAW